MIQLFVGMDVGTGKWHAFIEENGIGRMSVPFDTKAEAEAHMYRTAETLKQRLRERGTEHFTINHVAPPPSRSNPSNN